MHVRAHGELGGLCQVVLPKPFSSVSGRSATVMAV